jgi:hypothetical protein
MDFLKVLRAFLIKAYKLSDGDIDAILEASKDDQAALLQALYDKDKTRVSELTKPKDGQTFQDGYKKAKKEVLTELENELKGEFDLESEATGLDLVKQIVDTKGKAGKKTELTEDDVKKHPVYQQLDKSVKKQLKDKDTEWETKLSETEKGFKKAQVFGKVTDKALEALDELKPVYPANPKVAANLKKAFVKSLEEFEYEDQETGIVVMKGGKVVDDGHGHSLEFSKLAKERAADFFEFQANNGGNNAGNGQDNKQTGQGGNKTVVYPAGINKPKNFEEYSKIVQNSEIPVADRRIVADVWEQEQAVGTGT